MRAQGPGDIVHVSAEQAVTEAGQKQRGEPSAETWRAVRCLSSYRMRMRMMRLLSTRQPSSALTGTIAAGLVQV